MKKSIVIIAEKIIKPQWKSPFAMLALRKTGRNLRSKITQCKDDVILQ
jgi:hypothetical protein